MSAIWLMDVNANEHSFLSKRIFVSIVYLRRMCLAAAAARLRKNSNHAKMLSQQTANDSRNNKRKKHFKSKFEFNFLRQIFFLPTAKMSVVTFYFFLFHEHVLIHK